ncbi:hypothetical protein AC579_7312 [Pseudocercospora musae]|uniref:RING-type domain-containing protein n=1 Tax=Pseudocercospora musae TaxID=113226 RepID=A0A139I0X8_9PEZI|nr:hypothetical protein AC579_7312 [Pseudocercospora musae]
MSGYLFTKWLYNSGAQSLQVVTLCIPNPEWQGFGTDDQTTRVNASLSFNYLTSFNIRTLSTQSANNGNDVTGLMYVPDLPPDSACVNASRPYVPQNVTRQANLPNTDYDLIAMVPWVTPQCSLEYMEAARLDPVRGMVFFLPGNNTGTPADAKDDIWHIPDAGNWKQKNGFPVYAINGDSGAILLNASAEYSGNMTDVPYGHQLTEFYDSRDYVRLYIDIDTGSGTSLPSLWVFLLVVLGILLFIIGATSLSMHWLQRRRRQSLRRRVMSGEVDLEALGIKRLTVPQDLLSEMPLYTYGTGAAVAKVSPSGNTNKQAMVETEKLDGAVQSGLVSSSMNSIGRPRPVRATSYRPTPLSQPTCAICLDDFVAGSAEQEGTVVRELPCHHIFHPECVDTFLRDSSSLCPMCKKTALPKGYCPRVITNAMVRRERMIRQVRERVTLDPETAEDDVYPTSFGRLVRSMPGIRHYRQSRMNSMTPATNSQRMTQFEPAPETANSQVPLHRPDASNTEIQPVQQVQPPASASHRNWAQRRAENMLGRRAPEDPDAEEAQQSSVWRKAVHGLFPRR